MRRMQGAAAQRGSTLIEVLVALVVFSVGLIGMAALHGRAAQYAVNAEDRNRAALLADELVAQMWLAQSASVSAGTLKAWKARLADVSVSGLPNASGSVSGADANGAYTVTITWYPTANEDTTITSSNPYRYVTKAVLP